MGIERVITPMGVVGVGASPDLPTDADLVSQIVRVARILNRAVNNKGPLTLTRRKVVVRAIDRLEMVKLTIDTFGYDGEALFAEANKRIEKK